jgi:hypothetical protein
VVPIMGRVDRIDHRRPRSASSFQTRWLKESFVNSEISGSGISQAVAMIKRPNWLNKTDAGSMLAWHLSGHRHFPLVIA